MRQHSQQPEITRRDFLRRIGVAGAATTGLIACGGPTDSVLPAGEIPTDQMTHRTSPTSGDKVSLLGFGMMRLPSVGGRSAREGNEAIDQAMVNELVDYALAHGVNYFDTSPAYCQGKSEEATGIALSRHPRDSYFIATNLSNLAHTTWSREASLAMYHHSMEALQVDYFDYYLLHGVGMGGGMEEFEKRYIENGVLDFLLEERRAGRIRNLGFSYHGDVRVFDRLLAGHDTYRWDFVQIQLNYLDWKYAKQINPRNTDAEYLYNELHKRGIPMVIMEPLLGGRLSNVPDNIVERLKRRKPNRSVASWAFRFAGSLPGVQTVLSGMTRMEHLQDNLRSLAPLKPLTEEDFTFLQETATQMMQFDTIPCNDCKYCMPCPYGLDIPSILLHYNKCLNERNLPESQQDPHFAAARRAFLVGYDRGVPKLRQAHHCIGCNQCSPHCPQRINIPKELHRIDAYAERLRQAGGSSYSI